MNSLLNIVVALVAPVIMLFPNLVQSENPPGGTSPVSQPVVRRAAAPDSTQAAFEATEKFDPSRDAAMDIADAVVAAKREQKRILLDVGGEWCSWCHKLDQFFEEHADASAFLHQNFTVVKVNYSKENKNEAVLSRYPPVKGYPHLFVLEKDGTFLRSQDTGELESGDHHDHDKVLNFLKKWAPKREP
jgi:thiol:disulfide interchange protein